MKKLLGFAVAAAVLAPALVSAKNPPNNVGCGLGSIAFEGQSGTGPQVLAATTNGTLGNQTFGISFGTLGCSKSGEVNRPDKVAMFIGPNMNRLAQDMSRGQGEALASLAEVIGVEQSDRTRFYAATQSNFDSIFPNENVTAKDVMTSLNGVLSNDPELSRYVVS